jgi:hypothetical protein
LRLKNRLQPDNAKEPAGEGLIRFVITGVVAWQQPPVSAKGRDGVMRRSQDLWDIVPVRLVLASLAAAGLCAVIGLATVTDESSARKAAQRFRQLMAQRRSDFVAAGEPTAFDDRGMSKSISALIELGPRFRDVNRELQTQWKRIRRQDGLSGILDGTR